MGERESSTALLIFTERPLVASFDKPWLPSHIDNVRLHFKVARHLEKLAFELDVPFYIIDDRNQRGQCFQERLYNAVSDIFDKGYSSVLTVGGDIPSLTTSILKSAWQAMQEGRNALGPTADGGTYLIGLQKGSFTTLKKHNIHWNKGKDFQELLRLLTDVPLFVSEPLVDWDTSLDMIEDRKKNKSYFLWALLFRAIFNFSCECIRPGYRLPISCYVLLTLYRGPPIR
jgi:hypothetical protein